MESHFLTSVKQHPEWIVGDIATAYSEAFQMLSLAEQGRYPLHASAIHIGAGLILFTGESGRGKSTLARYLGRDNRAGWQRAADDILPLQLTKDGLEALPHFQQPRLRPEDQPGRYLPERVSVQAIYEIYGGDQVCCEQLSRRKAALSLVRHTVASRLFDKHLMASHLEFCARAAGRVPVYRLSYPHRPECLEQVEALLHKQFG